MSTAGTVVETDLLIIGAGPTGLFATYYAGFRGHRVAVVDSLPELGGQITAMYPEKLIFDVAGFPGVKGRTLVIGGEFDRLFPPNVCQEVANLISGANFALIDGAGHLSSLDSPKQFNELLLGFLGEGAARNE